MYLDATIISIYRFTFSFVHEFIIDVGIEARAKDLVIDVGLYLAAR